MKNSKNIINYMVLSFALWTVADNISYVLNKSLFFSSVLFVLLVTIGIIVWQKIPESNTSEVVSAISVTHEDTTNSNFLILAAVAFFIIWLLFFRNFIIFWFASIILLTISLLISKSTSAIIFNSDYSDDRRHRMQVFLLLGLCLAGVVLSLVAHRPDADDCIYLNRAAVVADNFFTSMPHYDTVYPNLKSSFSYPTFPLIAYHDLLGLLSWLLNLEPLAVSAYIATPIGGFLIILAYSLLLRTLFPKEWIWALIAIIILFVADGTSHKFFSNYAFVRIWQGKSIMLHIWMPLCMVYGLWFGSQGGLRNALLLTSAQIGMVGLSPVGLWMGPAVAGISLLIGAKDSVRFFKRLAAAIPTFFYPLAIGVIAYRSTLKAFGDQYYMLLNTLDPIFMDNFRSFKAVSLWYGVMLFSGLTAPTRRAKLFFTIFALVFFATFANPYLSSYIPRYITSYGAFWRIIWVLPLPVMAAGVCCFAFNTNLSHYKWFGPLIMVGMLSAYVIFQTS